MQIKKERMEEKLRLARLSQRLHFQDEGRGRLSHLYKKILTALHRQRKVKSEFAILTKIPSVDFRCGCKTKQANSIGSVSEVISRQPTFKISFNSSFNEQTFRKMTGRMRHG